MTKAETAILESKTPEAYIEASLKAKISPAAKARLARQWMERTGFTKDDILRARNRHPYWKKKKMEGSAERTRRRLSAHDYSGGKTLEWTPALIEEFLSLNGKNAGGQYLHRDWELAEHFQSSIPSIQYMRRKYRRVLEMLGPRTSKAKLVDYLTRAESVLVRGPEAVERLKDAEKAGARKTAPGEKTATKTPRGESKKVKAASTKGKTPAKPQKGRGVKAAAGRAKVGSGVKKPASTPQRGSGRSAESKGGAAGKTRAKPSPRVSKKQSKPSGRAKKATR